MGKGDKRTKRGKIFSKSYGKFRARKPKNKITTQNPPTATASSDN